MLTLYTAVGTLKFQKTTGGKTIPLVINNRQEYGLSDDELLLWSCLAFQILTLHELQDAYTLRQIQKEGPKNLSFQHYLNRLSLRGLVVSGIGLTGVDALYRLLGSLTIIPLEDTFPIRLFGCIQLYLEGSIGAKEFGRYLKKKPSSPMEDTILKLAEKVSLTTAELITSMDQKKVIHNESDIMDELYTEPETTYQTLVDDTSDCHTGINNRHHKHCRKQNLINPLRKDLFQLIFEHHLYHLPFLQNTEEMHPPVLSPPVLHSLPAASLKGLLVPLRRQLSLHFQSDISSYNYSVPF